MGRWFGCSAAGIVTLLSAAACNLVIGIEDHVEGQACSAADDCPAGDECNLPACEVGVCTTELAPDGTVCGDAGEACDAGVCACPANRQCGDSGCTDTATDHENCGGCGKPCLPAEACEDGECTCPPTNLCEGGCVDTSVSVTNCGGCGHDCAEAACEEGVCAPAIVAEDQGTAYAMVGDDTDLFVASDTGQINRVPKDGSAFETLGDGGLYGPFGIAVDATNVYFSTFNSDFLAVYSVPKDGGLTDTVAPDENYPGTMFLSDGTLFWTVASGVRAFDLPDGPPVDALDSSTFGGFVVDSDAIYYTLEDRVESVPRAGGRATVLASGLANPIGISEDSTYLYVVNEVTEDQLSAGEKVGSIVRVPKAGGDPEVLAEGLSNPISVRADDEYAYYIDATDQTITRVAKDGGPSTPFAKGFEPGKYIVFDEASAFVSDTTNGRILKIPR